MSDQQQTVIVTQAELLAQIQRLKTENEALRKRIEKSCRVINSQKRQIDEVRYYTWGKQRQARTELAKLETEHNPRAKYAYLKGYWTGVGEVAGHVFGLLFFDFATALINKLQEVGLCK